MRLSRFRAIHQGLNGIAKKVYEVVPMSTHWSQHKIMRELERLGKHLDPKVVQGCLGFMLAQGIIERDADGDYIRTVIKLGKAETEPASEIQPTEEEVEMATKPDPSHPPAPPSIFDILAALAQRAQSIEDQVSDLRDDIEKAALQAQQEAETNAASLVKLEKFKEFFAMMKDD